MDPPGKFMSVRRTKWTLLENYKKVAPGKKEQIFSKTAVVNFRGHLISIAREKKRMLETTTGHKTVFWLDMMAASDTKKNIKQKKHARMGTVKLDF